MPAATSRRRPRAKDVRQLAPLSDGQLDADVQLPAPFAFQIPRGRGTDSTTQCLRCPSPSIKLGECSACPLPQGERAKTLMRYCPLANTLPDQQRLCFLISRTRNCQHQFLSRLTLPIIRNRLYPSRSGEGRVSRRLSLRGTGGGGRNDAGPVSAVGISIPQAVTGKTPAQRAGGPSSCPGSSLHERDKRRR
jgi:hypothetical protein